GHGSFGAKGGGGAGAAGGAEPAAGRGGRVLFGADGPGGWGSGADGVGREITAGGAALGGGGGRGKEGGSGGGVLGGRGGEGGGVKFAAGMKRLKNGGYGVYLELGPGTTLIGLGKQDGGGEEAEWFSSLRRGQDDWSQTLESVAGLYKRGVEIDWKSFDEPY